MNPDTISQIVQGGPLVLLAVAVIYFYRRDLASDVRLQVREKEAQERCDSERKTMVAKIERLEDRISALNEQMTESAMELLAQNVRAMERFCDATSITPPHSKKILKDDP